MHPREKMAEESLLRRGIITFVELPKGYRQPPGLVRAGRDGLTRANDGGTSGRQVTRDGEFAIERLKRGVSEMAGSYLRNQRLRGEVKDRVVRVGQNLRRDLHVEPGGQFLNCPLHITAAVFGLARDWISMPSRLRKRSMSSKTSNVAMKCDIAARGRRVRLRGPLRWASPERAGPARESPSAQRFPPARSARRNPPRHRPRPGSPAPRPDGPPRRCGRPG